MHELRNKERNKEKCDNDAIIEMSGDFSFKTFCIRFLTLTENIQANAFTARGTNEIHVQWRIQDFQGALTPEFGAKNHYMTTKFLPKTAQKKGKKRGGGPLPMMSSDNFHQRCASTGISNLKKIKSH